MLAGGREDEGGWLQNFECDQIGQAIR